MRIIAGKFRGKVIPSPKEEIVKPTLDRVKENIFNILQFKIANSRVLDLFCGSGALGIECISRNADYVTFVDNNKANTITLQKFLTNLKVQNYEIKNVDFYDGIKGNGKYDIIFLDPPYESDLAEIAISKIYKFGILNDDGVIVWEHSASKDTSKFKHKITDSRKYGSVVVDFLQKEQANAREEI